ncbi:hypothetical protein ACIQ1J_30905 [Streptomyces sp. NPDC097107]|uniref:hypothetical protein n=1 Tax=Streptomyces sp. NPDC097107 TaxID=3366089 RepID=UPI003830AA13
MTNLARWFPVEVVGDLIGLPREGRERLLPLLDANFNCFGPNNARTQTSFPQLPELAPYVMASATRGALPEGSMGRAVYGTVDAGGDPGGRRSMAGHDLRHGRDGHHRAHAIGHTVWSDTSTTSCVAWIRCQQLSSLRRDAAPSSAGASCLE